MRSELMLLLRLIRAVHVCFTSGDRSHVILSDDLGETWRLGGDGKFMTNEATIAQLVMEEMP